MWLRCTESLQDAGAGFRPWGAARKSKVQLIVLRLKIEHHLSRVSGMQDRDGRLGSRKVLRKKGCKNDECNNYGDSIVAAGS